MYQSQNFKSGETLNISTCHTYVVRSNNILDARILSTTHSDTYML